MSHGFVTRPATHRITVEEILTVSPTEPVPDVQPMAAADEKKKSKKKKEK